MIILIIFSGNNPPGESPHGEKLKIDCSSCHTSDNWKYNTYGPFSHDKTDFPLVGQHMWIDCQSCHPTLVFNEAVSECYSCHHDIHKQTVGNDCNRCHTPLSWIVENVDLMHEKVSFPLTGVHLAVNCHECHADEGNMIFSPIGAECFDCHKDDYFSAKSPDHQQQDFPIDCYLCHSLNGPEWNSGQILHSFFPLTQGHEINDCKICHQTDNYNDISGVCYSCHQNDFQNATNPDHSQYPKECNFCHSLNSGWRPAEYSDHDSEFPIYSGKHKKEWDECMDCHTSAGNFIQFSCINCHEHNNQSKLAKEHDEVKDYKFDSSACYECHPKGNKE